MIEAEFGMNRVLEFLEGVPTLGVGRLPTIDVGGDNPAAPATRLHRIRQDVSECDVEAEGRLAGSGTTADEAQFTYPAVPAGIDLDGDVGWHVAAVAKPGFGLDSRQHPVGFVGEADGQLSSPVGEARLAGILSVGLRLDLAGPRRVAGRPGADPRAKDRPTDACQAPDQRDPDGIHTAIVAGESACQAAWSRDRTLGFHRAGDSRDERGRGYSKRRIAVRGAKEAGAKGRGDRRTSGIVKVDAALSCSRIAIRDARRGTGNRPKVSRVTVSAFPKQATNRKAQVMTKALAPAFATSRPGRTIPLWRGRLSLHEGTKRFSGSGLVQMRLMPDSHIGFRVSGPIRRQLGGSFDQPDLFLRNPRSRAAGLVLSSTERNFARVNIRGLVRGSLSFGIPNGLERALVHVFNFPTYLGDWIEYPSGQHSRGRVDLIGGGWTVKIDAVEDAAKLEKSLQADGGYALTHVAEIVRSDGSAFDADALQEVIEVTGYTLSFATSRWNFPTLVLGYAGGPEPQWQEWADRRLDAWAGRLTWYDHKEAASLAKVFDGLWGLWANPARRSVIRVALGWAVEANGRISPEGRLVLAQSSLELLAWQRLVIEGTVSNRRFKAMQADEQVRQLLAVSEVSSGLPGASASLGSTAAIGHPPDAPAAVVAIRNRIAHPPRSRSHALLPSGVLVTGWRLALSCLHASVLRWLDYAGPVVSAVDLRTQSMGAGPFLL